MAFATLKDDIKIADSMLKTVIRNTIEKCPDEMKLLNFLKDNTLLPTLNEFIHKKITVLDYKVAVKKLLEHKYRFEEKNIYFGMDLASEHEKFISESIVKGPVAIINYPKDIKAFYMYQNADNKTVACFDLLVPGIGELIGGSQRESRYDKLVTRMAELNIPREPLQ